MRLLCGFILVSAVSRLLAQQAPLTALPYMPSLDTSFMDKSADPCVNFYQYSCGNWNKLNPIPPDQPAWNVYAKMEDDNQRFLWGILQQAAQQSESRIGSEAKIGDYFQSCMNEAAIEQAGSKPIEPDLKEIATLKSVENIAAYIGAQHHRGMDRGTLFGFGSDQDFDYSSQVIAFASAGGLGRPDRDYYTKTDAKSQEIRQKYREHVGRMFVLLGESAPDAQSDAQVVMDIETAPELREHRRDHWARTDARL